MFLFQKIQQKNINIYNHWVFFFDKKKIYNKKNFFLLEKFCIFIEKSGQKYSNLIENFLSFCTKIHTNIVNIHASYFTTTKGSQFSEIFSRIILFTLSKQNFSLICFL